MEKLKQARLTTILPWILIIAGAVAVYCSFILSQDKIKLLQNPHIHLSCSLDPVVACGNVISSSQGHAFGFPNPFLGLAGYAAVTTIGIAMLAGAAFKRWFWLTVEAGFVFALAFLYWLLYQSVYRIHNLCPYCLVVDVVTITAFWYVTLYNIDQKNILLPKGKAQAAYDWIRRHHLDILLAWLIILAALILKHFWYYYGTKI
ncbi:MAG TPA: vitamin K epoxide reductase family protein [Candidatus Saccharimonadales bacterium]|nr:vitamin K epoxide reductase family protein [Candidatus Saccharimonadales bacterium]